MRSVAGAAIAVTTPSGDAAAFQQRALLDVQFHEDVIGIVRQRHPVQRTGKSGGGANLVEGRTLRVLKRRRAVRVERAGKQAAAQAAQAEARRFLRGKKDELDGTPRAEAGVLQGADRLQRAEHADRAVVASGMRNRVDVRSAGNRRQARFGARPARECVAHGIFADGEPGGGAPLLQPCARGQVHGGENDARDVGRLRDGEGRQRFQLRGDAVAIEYGGSWQWMPVPIFIKQILRRCLAQRAEPLRAVRAHPDEIARRDRIPAVVEPVDAAAFEHQQAVLHDVNFHHRKSGAGSEGHEC